MASNVRFVALNVHTQLLNGKMIFPRNTYWLKQCLRKSIHKFAIRTIISLFFWYQVWLTHVFALDLFLFFTTLWNIESKFEEKQCNHVLVLRISWFLEIIGRWCYHLFSSVIEIWFSRWKWTHFIWRQVLCYNLRTKYLYSFFLYSKRLSWICWILWE